MAAAHKTKPGFYTVELNKAVWEVPERYTNLTPVGSGAYGQVWSVSLGALGLSWEMESRCLCTHFCRFLSLPYRIFAFLGVQISKGMCHASVVMSWFSSTGNFHLHGTLVCFIVLEGLQFQCHCVCFPFTLLPNWLEISGHYPSLWHMEVMDDKMVFSIGLMQKFTSFHPCATWTWITTILKIPSFFL